MKSLVKHIVMIVLGLFVIICFLSSINYTKNLKLNRNTINIYLEGVKVDLESVKFIREEENKKENPIIFTAWQEKSNESIENIEFYRNAEVDILLVNGDSSIIVNGPILFEDDKDGCLIDKNTAYKLFGDYNVVGKKIKYNERELTIRGLHNGKESTVIMQTLNNYYENMNGIVIDNNKNINVDNFINEYNLSKNTLKSDFYYNISKICIFVIPTLIIVSVINELLKKFKEAKNKPILKLIYFFIISIILVIFIKCLDISIPLEILPNKWSDFEFWGNLYKTYEGKFKYIIYMKKYSMDIYMIEYVSKIIINTIISIICFLVLKRKILNGLSH